jgi:hypothetical protein
MITECRVRRCGATVGMACSREMTRTFVVDRALRVRSIMRFTSIGWRAQVRYSLPRVCHRRRDFEGPGF